MAWLFVTSHTHIARQLQRRKEEGREGLEKLIIPTPLFCQQRRHQAELKLIEAPIVTSLFVGIGNPRPPRPSNIRIGWKRNLSFIEETGSRVKMSWELQVEGRSKQQRLPHFGLTASRQIVVIRESALQLPI